MHESTEADRCKAAASAYVDEIMTDSVVSTSHITLGRGYMRFGREQFQAAVDAELAERGES